MESLAWTICANSDVFPVSELYNSDPQIMPPILDDLRFMASVDIGGF